MAAALQVCCDNNFCNLSGEKNEFEHFLYYVRLTEVDNIRCNVAANFVNAKLQLGDILSSRDTKCIESYGCSPEI